MVVASAVLRYNDGVRGLLPVLTEVGIDYGHFTLTACARTDICRVKTMNQKSSEPAKKRRKKLHALRKNFIEKDEQEEGGQTYASGAF